MSGLYDDLDWTDPNPVEGVYWRALAEGLRLRGAPDRGVRYSRGNLIGDTVRDIIDIVEGMPYLPNQDAYRLCNADGVSYTADTLRRSAPVLSRTWEMGSVPGVMRAALIDLYEMVTTTLRYVQIDIDYSGGVKMASVWGAVGDAPNTIIAEHYASEQSAEDDARSCVAKLYPRATLGGGVHYYQSIGQARVTNTYNKAGTYRFAVEAGYGWEYDDWGTGLEEGVNTATLAASGVTSLVAAVDQPRLLTDNTWPVAYMYRGMQMPRRGWLDLGTALIW